MKEMKSEDVLELLEQFKEKGIEVYVDGGWAVDALLGEQTRKHADLDIAIPHKHVPELRQVLGEKGYSEVQRDDTTEYGFVLRDGEGHEVDVHSYIFDEEGNNIGGIAYQNEFLTGSGTIDGRDVQCISAEHLVESISAWLHKFREKDFNDVAALCAKFDIEVPEVYNELIGLDSLLPNLAPPIDDDRADHVEGMQFPEISLKLASGGEINTAEFQTGTTVIYCYPITGTTERPFPTEDWMDIPGACGCTPQSVAYNELLPDFEKMNVRVFGLSTQEPEYQNEMRERMGLLFDILSDPDFSVAEALKLPTLKAGSMTLLSRLTMIIKDGTIVKVFYPIFPSNSDSGKTLEWLKENK